MIRGEATGVLSGSGVGEGGEKVALLAADHQISTPTIAIG